MKFWVTVAPLDWTETLAAASNSAPRSNRKCATTSALSRNVPLMSRTALTIWTHVVASMPPNTTYTIIRIPTPVTASAYPIPEPDRRRLTKAPAPTIWAIM